MACLVRKLLPLSVDTSNDLFWRTVFLDDLSFYQLAGLNIGFVVILVLCSATMSSLSTVRAQLYSRRLRYDIVSSFLHIYEKGESHPTTTAMDVKAVPNILIRQVAILERFKANHEIWILSEKLIVALCFVLVFVFTWQGGLIALALLILSEACGHAFDVFRKHVNHSIDKHLARVNAHTLDLLKNSDTVIVSQMAAKEVEQLKMLENQVEPHLWQSARLKFSGDLLRIGITVLIPAVIAITASPGIDGYGVVAALLLLDEAHKSLVHLVFVRERAAEARDARENINEWIESNNSFHDDLLPEEKDCGEAGKTSGKNQLDETEFFIIPFAGQKTPILRNVSMLLEKEKIHALVGESGCGKSSTLKLMAGLVTHQSGTLRLNTSKVHYMPQASSSTMFARSLRENLTYGLSQDLDRSSEESTIWEALRSVDLASFVQGLPEGLDSIVDESSLSGGEKQRFQLARLLCNQDAELVLIDEGLSELDGRRRKKIIQVLQDALRGKTGVVVTHHDNILTICDKIHAFPAPRAGVEMDLSIFGPDRGKPLF
eukprot:CAMPEP_0197468998 /NCGR_PEP_ID=MMETSP1175-20131217/66377_1 /TAXON_ID=1003142 /ORGANISM="Triceratium dubium, Strain CCMP147" /LENGTH=544 /DNA_ID=CAMNT_0043005129 /DNA_START=265 /DNA_END=1901 /DNA_ORIENTATION=-